VTDERLDPPLSTPTYAVRAPLVRWLAAEAARAATELGAYRLLDVGCGEMPYLDLFEPHTQEIVGLDTWDNPRASLRGPIEAIPAPDASFDVVLCAQVLEHVDDPAQGVRELARVTRPGGRVRGRRGSGLRPRGHARRGAASAAGRARGRSRSASRVTRPCRSRRTP
jgi:SAM-dependent methyltransferase